MIRTRSPYSMVQTVAWQAACLIGLSVTMGMAAAVIANGTNFADFTSRTVVVEKNEQRRVLGDGRVMNSAAALKLEEPHKTDRRLEK